MTEFHFEDYPFNINILDLSKFVQDQILLISSVVLPDVRDNVNL